RELAEIELETMRVPRRPLLRRGETAADRIRRNRSGQNQSAAGADGGFFRPTRDILESMRRRIREHRDSRPITDAGPTCDACEDTGFEIVDVDGVRRARPCACRRHVNVPTWADDVPMDFRGARLANYRETPENTHAITAGREWLAGQRRDLYLFGPTGTGKSRLAATLLNEAYVAGQRSAMYVYVPRLIQLQVHAVGVDDPSMKRDAVALLERCRLVDPLVLDDVAGAEPGTDFSRRHLLTLYEERINAGRRTIWTSNLSLDGVAEFLGDDRLLSRIAGRAGDAIELVTTDFRLTPPSSSTRPAATRVASIRRVG